MIEHAVANGDEGRGVEVRARALAEGRGISLDEARRLIEAKQVDQ